MITLVTFIIIITTMLHLCIPDACSSQNERCLYLFTLHVILTMILLKAGEHFYSREHVKYNCNINALYYFKQRNFVSLS